MFYLAFLKKDKRLSEALSVFLRFHRLLVAFNYTAS
jgi:hypothetical protein